jgi:hypothetical protein
MVNKSAKLSDFSIDKKHNTDQPKSIFLPWCPTCFGRDKCRYRRGSDARFRSNVTHLGRGSPIGA